MLSGFRILMQLAVWTILFGGVYLFFDYVLRDHPQPFGYYVMSGAVVSFMMLAMQRGWVRGVFRDPRRVQERKDRAAQLAEERAQVIARLNGQ